MSAQLLEEVRTPEHGEMSLVITSEGHMRAELRGPLDERLAARLSSACDRVVHSALTAMDLDLTRISHFDEAGAHVVAECMRVLRGLPEGFSVQASDTTSRELLLAAFLDEQDHDDQDHDDQDHDEQDHDEQGGPGRAGRRLS